MWSIGNNREKRLDLLEKYGNELGISTGYDKNNGSFYIIKYPGNQRGAQINFYKDYKKIVMFFPTKNEYKYVGGEERIKLTVKLKTFLKEIYEIGNGTMV